MRPASVRGKKNDEQSFFKAPSGFRLTKPPIISSKQFYAGRNCRYESVLRKEAAGRSLSELLGPERMRSNI